MIRFSEWRGQGGHYAMFGTEDHGQEDVMAKVSELSPNHWKVTWWARPFAPDTRQSVEFTGTLEEAQAMAVVMVRMG